MVSKLQNLINSLEQDINVGVELSHIKEPNLLLNSLKDLRDNIISMDGLKDQIAEQTFKMIKKLKAGLKNDKMLNAVICGEPGTGKSTVAKKFANICNNLGILEQKEFTLTEKIQNITNDDSQVLLILLVFIIPIVKGLMYTGKFLFNNFSPKINMFLITSVFIFLFFGCLIASSFFIQTDYQGGATKIENSSDSYVMATCGDVTDKYMGGTEKRTLSYINKNRGKFIIFDEAGSLLSGSHDEYGKKALKTMTEYSSNNPNSVGFIFCGYKDELNNGIFRVEPGLKSRCMHQFECDKYSPLDLCKIFSLQLLRVKLKIRNKDKNKILDIFTKCEKLFKNNARDTERLVEYVENSFYQYNDIGDENFISLKDLKSGLITLSKNNIMGSTNNNNYTISSNDYLNNNNEYLNNNNNYLNNNNNYLNNMITELQKYK